MKDKDIEALLHWYDKNKRDLPWRNTKDPYKIWISEVMLQQTRVEAVKVYYERFLNSLPTLKDLANVDDDQLLKLWEGLGYYHRALHLKKCAQELLKRGFKEFPQDERELLSLPGIGPYTAGAILSIAYDQCVPAIDGNVMRVLARIFEDERDFLKKTVWVEYYQLLKSLMKEEFARSFTEAFIELGALVCMSKGIPKCSICPLQNICKCFLHQTMQLYPVKKKKKERKKEDKTILVFQYKDEYFLQKRESEGLLSGMYGFFQIDSSMDLDEVECFLKIHHYSFTTLFFLGDFKHVFSHVEWQMKAYVVVLSKKIEGKFYPKEVILQRYSLPTAFMKIFKQVIVIKKKGIV